MTIETATYSEVWQECMVEMQEQIPEREFAKWFQPIIPLSYDRETRTLRLRLPSVECVNHIESNYIPSLRPIIYGHFGDNTRVRYAVPSTPEEPRKAPATSVPAATAADNAQMSSFIAQKDTANIKNPFVIPGIKKLVIDPQLNPNYNFGTFIEGECNRLVRSVGLAVAIAPGKTAYNPLYIFGDSGLGKTHLAQAIGLEIKQRFPDKQVLYVPMSKFQAQYTTAMINKEPNDFINFYQMLDVLIIDDIQELSGNKSSTQNAFFNIFNHLHLTGKQLIITSDKRPSELSDINDRLLTRFKWGMAAELTKPDFETRVRIIENKARALDVLLSKEVIEYFAENIKDNVREIQGVLISLKANHKYMGRKVSLSLAKEIMKNYVMMRPKEITIEYIRKVVCDYLKIDESVIDSPKRTREVAQARQIAMYLCKQHTKAPLSAIGAAVGGKNHATVLHACKAVSNLMETDKAFALTMEEITRQVLAK